MGINSPLPVRLQDEAIKAAKIIRSFVDSQNNGLDKVIPRSVLEKAYGFAVFTVIKAGFLFSARAGSGLVIAKLEDGSWSAPSAIGLGGFGFGGQLGAEVTDFLIVLNSRTAVRTFMAAGSMTLGGNLSVAVGPLGRNAEGSGSLNSKGKAAALYSYSKTKGLFGGVSVEGSIIVERQDANRLAFPNFGSSGPTSKELLSGVVPRPYWADALAEVLDQCTGMPGGRKWVDDRYGFDYSKGYGTGEAEHYEGGRYGADDLDDGRGPDLSSAPPSRRTEQTGMPRSPSMGGGDYAFGAEGVGSFSSSSPARPKNNRARSSSLASSMWKMDLMGNTTKPTSGSTGNSPKGGRSRASSLLGGGGGGGAGSGSPGGGFLGSMGRKKSTLSGASSPFPAADEEQGRMDDHQVTEYGRFRLSEEGGAGLPRASTESNPFEAPDEKASRRQGRNLMDVDLSSVVISPWDNEKGVAATPPPSRFVESNTRDRSASLASQRTTTPRDRSKSNPPARAQANAEKDDDDLLGEWEINPDLDGLTTSFKHHTDFNSTSIDFATRGGQLDMDDFGSQRPRTHSYERPFATYARAETRSRSGSSPKPLIPMRKELLDGLEDGIPRAIALFAFDGTMSGDLAFKKGDVIVVTKGDRKDEWWTGRNTRTGSSGIFPANHVELANVKPTIAAGHNRRVATGFE